MKIVINNYYTKHTAKIESIPDVFETSGTTIYHARNTLKKFCFGSSEFIVKSFRSPHLLNRIAYTFLRKSKAQRAYEYALTLLSKNIQTPYPVAFLELQKNGLFCHSYFISEFIEDYAHVREQMYGRKIEDGFLYAFVQFINEMHIKGILHKDLSPGNILYKQSGNTFKFMALDINRMEFREKISIKARCKNFERLTANPEVLNEMAKIYAEINHFNPEQTLAKMKKYSGRFFKGRKNI